MIPIFLVFVVNQMTSQRTLSHEDLIPHTIYFEMDDKHEFGPKAEEFLLDAIGLNQFVGLAEVHQSQRLSHFTIGILELLKKKGFNYFALELGPYTAKILQEISSDPSQTLENIKTLNRQYGKKVFPKIPMIFVDKVADAAFIERASSLDYSFWGLDQEFSYSYEMHIDRMYKEIAADATPELTDLYFKSKGLIRQNIFKSKIDGVTKNCWLLEEPNITRFMDLCKSLGITHWVSALKTSWKIYCLNESGKASNQKRADYMKTNFDSLYAKANRKENRPKVFVKLGGVHLTHGISVFKVNDVGLHLSELGKKNRTGFLSIRHLSTYRDGKNVTGKKGWEGLELLMSLGKKDQWTLIDLRPMKLQLKAGNLQAEKKIAFEINNYDLVLIPPNDSKSKMNY